MHSAIDAMRLVVDALGYLWGVWHLPLFLLTSGDSSGALDFALFVPAILFCLLVLPISRVLMVLIYDRTTSLFLAILMHASLTGAVAMVVIPLNGEGMPMTVWYLVFSAALAVVTTALIKERSQRPARTPWRPLLRGPRTAR